MVDAKNIQWVSVDSIKPYENNPRDNSAAIPKVAESIKNFGFLSPIVCDGNGVILAGHTRFAAAKSLNLYEVPVIFASNLTDSQAKAYRLADNKVSEFARWDEVLLVEELDDLAAFDIPMESFGFDLSEIGRRRKSWAVTEKRCNLKKKIKQHSQGDFIFTSFYEASKDGLLFTEIKSNPANVEPFSLNLCDYLDCFAGNNLSSANWCICTTPRRRHKEGFHFSTEICKLAAQKLNIPFYVDAFTAKNRGRVDPEFTMEINPAELNVILYDDIISTGETITTVRKLLLNSGHVVFAIVGIKNRTFA